MRKIIVGHNQSIWDIAVQEYGSYDAVKQLILDNASLLNFTDAIAPGTQLIISAEPTGKQIVDFLAKKSIKPSTAIESPMVSNWILATGLWNDNGFWDDNALWID